MKVDPFPSLPEHLKKASRAADRKDRDRAELFAALVASPGWKAYEELLNSIIEAQGLRVLDPAGSVDGAVRGEYEKGTMRGLIMARDLPALTIEQAKSLNPTPDVDTDSEKLP